MLDVVICKGSVINTNRQTKRIANIGIKDGEIVCVTGDDLTASIVIDAQGLIVSPGFIDVHGHVDGYLYSGELSACQGITTSIGGNCGLSPIDFDDFFYCQEKAGFYINQGELVGHSFSLRQAAGISNPYRRALPCEFDRMKSMARAALDAGACGISFGLDYSPGASFAEITSLASICADFDRVMPIHTRLFTQNDLYSLFEVLSIAKRTGVTLLFSHFVYQYGSGIMRDALAIIEKAIQDGLNIKIDSGMYMNWLTFIGTATFDEQTINDNEIRFSDMIAASGPYKGQRLNLELYRLMRQKYPNDSVICCVPNDATQIYAALKPDYAMPSTDIGQYLPGEGHPQIAGSFPKYIKEMVRERHDLTLEAAIYKATLLPAQTFHLDKKGQIEIGMDADLTIFNLSTIKDRAVFPDQGCPDNKPEGIEYVLVNGVPVVYQGVFTGKKPGRVLRA